MPGREMRELINVIERAVIMSDGPELQLDEKLIPSPVDSGREALPEKKTTPPKGLADVQRDHILNTLRETGWRIEGPRGAAQLLGINPSTLRTRMRKLDIRRPGIS